MPSNSQPIYRKNFPSTAGTPFALTPNDNFSGCVLIEEALDGSGNKIAVFRLYVSASTTALASATVTYTPMAEASFWIVDIPEPNVIDLDQIAVAIVNGDPDLNPPPLVWGNPT